MKKAFTALFLWAGFSSSVWAQPADAAAVVAVFDIENRGSPLSPSELSALTDYLGTRLGESGRFRIVPRQEIRSRLVEQKRNSFKSCYDQSCQIELGRELAAQFTVSASISKVGSMCLITAAMYDLKKAATSQTASAKERCDADSLVAAIEQVAAKLLGTAAVVEKAPPPEPIPTYVPEPAPVAPPPVTKKVKTKSVLVAGLLSILPGGGMYYVGQWGWGLVYTCLAVGSIGAGFSQETAQQEPNYVYIYIGLAASAWIGGAVHAMIAAHNYEEEVPLTAEPLVRAAPDFSAVAGRNPHPPLVLPLFFGRF